MKTKVIIAFAAAQVLVLAYMAGEREWVLRTGRIIYLCSAPRDPRDAMRGDYVRVSYDMSSVPRGLCRGGLATTNKTFEAVTPDTKVYAILQTNEEGVAELEGLSPERPTKGLFLRGRTERSWGDHLQVRYGVEAFFMQQGKAEALERAPDRDAVRVPLEMKVAVSPGGVGVLKDYRRGALGIGLRLETKEEAEANGQRRRRAVAATIRLFNASSNELAVMDFPNGRSLALVPAAQRAEIPWHWAHEGEGQPDPASARVIVLKPGESHSIAVTFDDPMWSVWKVEQSRPGGRSYKSLADLGQDWSARFRLEYRPPDREACAKLPNGNLIWHGGLASRAFSVAGTVD